MVNDKPLHQEQAMMLIGTTAAIKTITCCLLSDNHAESKQVLMETEFPEMPKVGSPTYSSATAYMRAVMAKCIEMIDRAEEPHDGLRPARHATWRHLCRRRPIRGLYRLPSAKRLRQTSLLELPMASHYEEVETTLEYEFEEEVYELELSVRYRVVDYSPPQAFEDAEGECELKEIRVLGALVGPDALEASPETLKAIQKHINKDREAFARICDLVEMQIS